MYSFSSKWSKVKSVSEDADERSLFVDIGKKPVTQRQLNLYYYFLFIKDILEHTDAKNVLEIGCGRGTIALYLSKYLNLNLSLLDNSSDAIEIAKGEFSKYNQRATFYARDALQTGLSSEYFDAVVSIGLAEHFEDINPLFKEQYRLLRKGGIIVSLNIPKKFSIRFLNTLMRFLKKCVGAYKDSITKDYYRNLLKPREYQASAEKAGFQDVYIVHIAPFPLFTPIKMSTDKKMTSLYKFILRIRSLFQKYPYKTNSLLAQAHFLVGYKR